MNMINPELSKSAQDPALCSLLQIVAYVIQELDGTDLKYARYMAQVLYYELDEQLAGSSTRD